jgi:Uma2 family endonuclease
MATRLPRGIIAVNYAEYARDYLRSLPPEHFMESPSQGHQRTITLASLALVSARRPEVQVFNELLIQYPRRGQKRPGQVVPDNMVVLWDEPLKLDLSFDTLLQPKGPFWVMEYVSRNSKRKDYEESFEKYEKGLKVPHYLTFYPEDQELTLYRHTGRKYVSVKPNEAGRYAIPELDLEVALLDRWARFWYEGALLPLPADLQRDLDRAHLELAAERQAREAAEREIAELRAQLGKLPGGSGKRE